MKYAGITDEAGRALSQQLKAQKTLGWELMELRSIDGVYVGDMPEGDWQQALKTIQEAGQQVIAFSGNVGFKHSRIDRDFSIDLAEMKQVLPRMQESGASFYRCMSFPNSLTEPLPEDARLKETVYRLKTISQMAADAGVVIVHENCSGYGSMSPEHGLRLVEEVDHPAFKLVYDVGNPGHHPLGINAWEWYQPLKEHVVHVHVKDYLREGEEHGVTCMPGEGNSGLDLILKDLKDHDYAGVLSIEPHLPRPHEDDTPEGQQWRYDTYLEHGQKLMRLWDSL